MTGDKSLRIALKSTGTEIHIHADGKIAHRGARRTSPSRVTRRSPSKPLGQLTLKGQPGRQDRELGHRRHRRLHDPAELRATRCPHQPSSWATRSPVCAPMHQIPGPVGNPQPGAADAILGAPDPGSVRHGPHRWQARGRRRRLRRTTCRRMWGSILPIRSWCRRCRWAASCPAARPCSSAASRRSTPRRRRPAARPRARLVPTVTNVMVG